MISSLKITKGNNSAKNAGGGCRAETNINSHRLAPS